MAKKKESTDIGFENVENVLSKTEKYIEENQKSLTIIVLIIAAIIALISSIPLFKKQAA